MCYGFPVFLARQAQRKNNVSASAVRPPASALDHRAAIAYNLPARNQLSEKGVALEITAKSTKYSKDRDLN
jgi:hypothetical protein